MPFKMTIDDFLPAARVLVRINPSCRGQSPESLAQWAMDMTRKNMDGPSYWSSRGFVVTTFYPEFDPVRLYVHVSVMTYSVEKFIEEVDARKEPA